MATMAKKNQKPPDEPKESKDPWYRLTIRLKQPMGDLLEELAERMGQDVITEIRAAIRERLEKFNLWPPSKTKE